MQEIAAECTAVTNIERVVRKQRQNKSTTPSMSYNGVTAETDNDICKLWSNYFSDLYTPYKVNIVFIMYATFGNPLISSMSLLIMVEI
jgi:hypothetical protein